MASSGEEEERVPRSVTDYYFEDEHHEPISFAELPLQWPEGESSGGKRKSIVLRGKVDNGIRNIYVPVTAWKFDLLDAKLKISVLSKNCWVKLQSPKKCYAENIIRTILITLHVLHFCRSNLRSTNKSLSEHLSQVYRYGRRFSKDDLMDHMDLVGEAVRKDKVLAKSKFVITLLEEKNGKTKKNKAFAGDAKATKMSEVLCDDIIEEVEGSSSDDDDEKGVCDICDDGGNILRCEGECLRAFHPTEENNCKSLGYATDEVEAICNFFCKNCKYKRHQCFICGRLGSSDKDSAVAEVFRCVSGECGRFYHPLCVSKLLHRGSEDEARLLKEKIASGASFTCPIHRCSVCNQGEVERDDQMRFAVCRRCPKSYHRKCLPREISFVSVNDEGITVRAWDTILPKKRILIYCLDHEIDMLLGTPLRNHVKFPTMTKKKQALEVLSRGEKSELNMKTPAKNASREKASVKSPIQTAKRSSATNVVAHKRSICLPARPDSSKKQKARNDSHVPLEKSSLKVEHTINNNKTGHDVKSCTEGKKSLPTLGSESEKRVLALMKDVSSSITIGDIYRKHKRLTTNANKSQNAVDKITLGKVQGSVKALHAALQKLEEGCSIEDAKAVCGPGLLRQMAQWKTKLRIYMEPFLLGEHYTSHGRYFTKSDKLQKVVDILHSYIQEDDMIVDFGCGANEFSFLLKKQLDEVGKKCSYKNYDIIYPKNDFHFERRNWMSVHPSELLPGSQLIIGLNPPFGVDASRVNQFINKALKFMPKLVVLIVPSETERLDRKNPPYDLLFEDNELLTDKAFYLPGSLDVDGKLMEQWNIPTLSLYFWSRPDWTAKHMTIARQLGHLGRGAEVSNAAMSPCQKSSNVEECDSKSSIANNFAADLCDDRMKTSTMRQSTESKHTADLCDDGKKTSTRGQSTESNHMADLCEDRMKTSTLRQSTESYHMADLYDGRKKTTTLGQSTESNHMADLRDDRMKTCTGRQSTESNHTTELCEDRMKTCTLGQSTESNHATDLCEDKMKTCTLRQSTESDHTANLCDSRIKTSTLRLSTESNETANICDVGMKTSTPRQPAESNHTADLHDDKMKTSSVRQHAESKHTKGKTRLDSLGFAPGPYRPLLNNSAGWLEE